VKPGWQISASISLSRRRQRESAMDLPAFFVIFNLGHRHDGAQVRRRRRLLASQAISLVSNIFPSGDTPGQRCTITASKRRQEELGLLVSELQRAAPET
jgi:hypothetical protein